MLIFFLCAKAMSILAAKTGSSHNYSQIPAYEEIA